jgi:hypothetical protein
MSEIWEFKQYFKVKGNDPILADKEYSFAIDYIGNDKVKLGLKLADGSFPTIVASPDNGFYAFGWEDEYYKYLGMVIGPTFRNLQVLVGIIERIPLDITPDSDMGTFTATKPIGYDSVGSS